MRQIKIQTIYYFIITFIALLNCNVYGFANYNDTPLTVDSRIRTYIYNPNEIFQIKANYNFQTLIEFSKEENIKTLAIGDASGWNIKYLENKIFIRPTYAKGRTNIIITTTEATYIVDIIAVEDKNDPDLMYIIRFHHSANISQTSVSDDVTEKYIKEKKKQNILKNINSNKKDYRYIINSSSRNPKYIKIKEVFNDGKTTFFSFKDNKHLPKIFIENENKDEVAIPAFEWNGYIVINGTHSSIDLRYKNEHISIKHLSNEKK
ncbi:MAG: TrbG/VirB9 family P-type conjugative transfer protein [Anaplasmataceae bacterium]|nr:TrbG/VirB9 family P-type conjugative transfer protein [Anaplasmataceae bacterium]